MEERFTATPIVGMSNEDAEALVDKYFYVGPRTLRLAGKTCHKELEGTKISLSEFQEGYKLDKSDLPDLKLQKPIVRYDTDRAKFYFQQPSTILLSCAAFSTAP